MDKLDGQLIYARTTQAVPASLYFAEGWTAPMAVICEIGGAKTQVNILSVSPPEGQKKRQIVLDNGNKFYCNNSYLPAYLDGKKWHKRLDKAERSSWWMLTLIAVISSTLLGAFLYFGLPRFADFIAHYMPETIIDDLSNDSLEQLDLLFFDETKLSAETQAEITTEFVKLRKIAQLDKDVELLFRSSSIIGANALALPNGPIVLTDELIEIAPSQEGIMGVVAHELAHVSAHHGQRNLARSLLFSLIGYLTGINQNAEQQAAIAQSLLFSKFSREFETEADDLARQWMKEASYDVKAFDAMLEALYQSACKSDDCTDEPTGWFDSHPALRDRLSDYTH